MPKYPIAYKCDFLGEFPLNKISLRNQKMFDNDRMIINPNGSGATFIAFDSYNEGFEC